MIQWDKKSVENKEVKQTDGWGGRSYIAIAVLLAVGLSGCGSKEDQLLYSKIRQRSPQLKTLQQSQKVLFHQGDENETIVLATYLPEAQERGETFFLSVYPGNRLAGRDPFKLQGKDPDALSPVAHTSLPPDVRRTVPKWFSSYRVIFPPVRAKKMTLSIRNIDGEVQTALFFKGPKYLVTKPKF